MFDLNEQQRVLLRRVADSAPRQSSRDLRRVGTLSLLCFV
jgi:hypothetical protein